MATNASQIQDFLHVLHKRRWQVALPTMFVLALGALFAVIVPKKFEVDMRIELRQARLNEALDPTNREIGSMEYHIIHDLRIRKIIEEQGDLWPEYVRASPLDRGKVVGRVMKNIGVEILGKTGSSGSDFVDVTYADVDADRAEKFLKRLTRVWIDEVVEREKNQLEAQRDIIQDDLSRARKDYDRLNRQFIDLAKSMGIDPTQPVESEMPGRGDAMFVQLERARSERGAIEEVVAQLRGELEQLREQAADEPSDTAEIVDVEGVSFGEQIADAQGDIRTLESELERLTPSNSLYRQYRATIATLQAKIDDWRRLETPATQRIVTEPNPERERIDSQIRGKESELNGKLRRLEHLNATIARLLPETQKRLEDYKELGALDGERALAWKKVGEKEYSLTEKDYELRVMQDAQGRPFEMVKEPEAPKAPSDPNPFVIVMFALVAGLALGLGIAGLAEFGTDSFRTLEDLKEVMAVPVLGTINTIVTRSEIRARQLRRGIVGFSTAVILGGVAWFTWTWASTPDRLPIEVLKAIDGIREILM